MPALLFDPTLLGTSPLEALTAWSDQFLPDQRVARISGLFRALRLASPAAVIADPALFLAETAQRNRDAPGRRVAQPIDCLTPSQVAAVYRATSVLVSRLPNGSARAVRMLQSAASAIFEAGSRGGAASSSDAFAAETTQAAEWAAKQESDLQRVAAQLQSDLQSAQASLDHESQLRLTFRITEHTATVGAQMHLLVKQNTQMQQICQSVVQVCASGITRTYAIGPEHTPLFRPDGVVTGPRRDVSAAQALVLGHLHGLHAALFIQSFDVDAYPTEHTVLRAARAAHDIAVMTMKQPKGGERSGLDWEIYAHATVALILVLILFRQSGEAADIAANFEQRADVISAGKLPSLIIPVWAPCEQMAALLSMVCLTRDRVLVQSVLRHAEWAALLADTDSSFRTSLDGLVHSQYADIFRGLNAAAAIGEHDMAGNAVTRQMQRQVRNNGLMQFVAPYRTLRMAAIGDTFGLGEAEVEEALYELINDGKIASRIDHAAKVLRLVPPRDPTATMVRQAVAAGRLHVATAAAALRVHSMARSGLCVPAPPQRAGAGKRRGMADVGSPDEGGIPDIDFDEEGYVDEEGWASLGRYD